MGKDFIFANQKTIAEQLHSIKITIRLSYLTNGMLNTKKRVLIKNLLFTMNLEYLLKNDFYNFISAIHIISYHAVLTGPLLKF